MEKRIARFRRKVKPTSVAVQAAEPGIHWLFGRLLPRLHLRAWLPAGARAGLPPSSGSAP